MGFIGLTSTVGKPIYLNVAFIVGAEQVNDETWIYVNGTRIDKSHFVVTETMEQVYSLITNVTNIYEVN